MRMREPADLHRRRNRAIATAALALVQSTVAAQTLNGVADWTVNRSLFESAGQETTNSSVAQTYTLGYRSVLWDPRFLRYDAEVTLQKNGLRTNRQRGNLRNIGYNVTSSLFPARPFPLTVQASRSYGGQSGDFPSAPPIRGGLTLPPGSVAPDFRTVASSLGVNWLLATERLPRVELSYHQGGSEVAAGPFEGRQRDSNLGLAVTRETPGMRHAVRAQRTAYDNLLSDVFKERLTDIGYDVTRTVSRRARATARAGYRRTYSLYDLAPQFTDVGRGAYLPPARGDFTLYYGVGTLGYRAAERLTTELTTSYDRGRSAAGSTESTLLASTARYQVFSGLTVSGTAITGSRDQRVAGAPVTMQTRSVVAGLDYTVALPLVQTSIGGERGTGWNTGVDGAAGRSRLWTLRAGMSTRSLKWLTLSGGHERGANEDDLLTFGNVATERTHAAARTHAGPRVLIEGSWETSRSRRATLDPSEGRFVILSGGANVILGERRRMAVAGGEYRNTAAFGTDRNQFVGATYTDRFGRLRLWASARRESSRLMTTALQQHGYYTVLQAEYRLRLFGIGLEHRYTTMDYAGGPVRTPFGFTGNQLLLRVIRKFSIDMGGE